MSNRKDINMKEELLGRHHEVMSKLREVEVIRAYYGKRAGEHRGNHLLHRRNRQPGGNQGGRQRP